MLNKEETYKILGEFFNDCVRFWILNGAKDYKEAFVLAIKDVEGIKHDPYLPKGELLHTEAKSSFIKNKKIDLEGKQEVEMYKIRYPTKNFQLTKQNDLTEQNN